MSKERDRVADNSLTKNLLLPQFECYLRSWHQKIGDQNKVIYNGIGPDVSTVLLFSNARQITGIDTAPIFFEDMANINKFRGNIDTDLPKDFVRPSQWPIFSQDLIYRSKRGYWDCTSVHSWGIPKLLTVELISLGIRMEDVKVSGTYGETHVQFTWAYPDEVTKEREIIYLLGPLDIISPKKREKFIRDADCFYQKSLPAAGLLEYPETAKQYLSRKAVVALSQRFRYQIDNQKYIENISRMLGHSFNFVEPDEYWDNEINKLPEDEGYHENNRYGMKLNVFQRG